MTSNWESVNPNQLLPGSLVSAINGVSSALTSVLGEIAGLSIPTIPSVPSANPIAAVVAAILDTLQGLLKAGRIHTLAIPIAKNFPPNVPPLPPTLDNLQASLDITLGPSTPQAANAYANMVTRNGGNAGFYNAFAQSLSDLGDPNRPQYDSQSDAVVMVTLLVGAPSYSSIVSAASTLDILTRPKGGNGLAARTVPIPQSVSAKVVGASSGPGVGVRIDWQAPTGASIPLYFPGVSISVSRYAVIKSTDVQTQSARTVMDLFSTQSLTVGLTSGNNTVVAIGTGTNSAYLDTATFDPTVPTYYCVAWECKVTENGNTTTLPFDRVSNVSKVSVKKPTPPQTGTSPNWVATDAAIDAFPSLAEAAQQMLQEAAVLLKPSAGPTDKLTAAVAAASGAAQRVAARSSELVSDVQRLAAALARPIPSMYLTQMSSGTGGNAFLLSQLATRLGDTTDSNRPPFDHGEYVCGVCFVAGAPRLADLATLIAFFEALFGSASNAANPVVAVINSIDTLVTAAETAVFGPGMQPLPSGTTGIDPVTGKPFIPPTPVIGANGVAVTAANPANPNAGDTNVTDTSELC